MAIIPFQGTWRIKYRKGLATEILPSPLKIDPFVEITEDQAENTAQIQTIAPDYLWQVDATSEDFGITGSIRLVEEDEPRFGFVIYRWFPTKVFRPLVSKKRVRGLIYLLVRPNDPFGEDPGDPGAWEAEEEGAGGGGD